MIVPSWVKGACLLVATLTTGVAIGVAYERHRPLAHEAEDMDASHTAMHHLSHVLALDSAQQHAVARILAHHQGAVDSTWHSMQPHVHATLDSAMQEVLQILRPDQAARFRTMVNTMHPGTPGVGR